MKINKLLLQWLALSVSVFIYFPFLASASETTERNTQMMIAPDSPMLEQIRVLPAVSDQVPMTVINAPVRIMADPTRLARIALPVTGRISALMVKPGDKVVAGQPLLTMESAEVDEAVSVFRQAVAESRQAEAEVRKAELDLQRMRDLLDVGAVARKEVVEAETDFVHAEAELEQANAGLQHSRQLLAMLGIDPAKPERYMTVTTPRDGKVIDILVSQGDFYTEYDGPAIVIADLDTVLAIADIPENKIRFMHQHIHAVIQFTAFPGEDFHAQVVRISDVIDPDTRTMRVFMQLDNPQGRLRQEMFGQVRFTGEVQDVPIVPVSAVVYRDNGSFVMVEHSRGIFESRKVVVGRRYGEQLPVLEGIKSGERVVVDGAILLISHSGILR